MMRNLVTSLIEHESIVTTYSKAKYTQRVADKIISMTKRKDYDHSKVVAGKDLFKLKETIPKLFKDLRLRYADRKGGYTRVIRLEPRLGDNADQAIVELVDGPREMKLWLTARVVARLQQQNLPIDPLTQTNVDKLIKLRKGGKEEFDKVVEIVKKEFYKDPSKLTNLPPPVENMRKPYTGYTLKSGFKIMPRPRKE